MKSSALIATCGALLVAASPILQGRRLYTKTDLVVEYVTVTVTEGDIATAFDRSGPRPAKATTTSVAPESSSTSVAPPPPPSTTSVEPVPEPTPEPAPETTTAAPVVQPAVQAAEPSPEPVVVAATTTQAAAAAQPTDYISTALYHHNVHRFNHSAAALEWSDEHAGYAQTLANTCNFAHDT